MELSSQCFEGVSLNGDINLAAFLSGDSEAAWYRAGLSSGEPALLRLVHSRGAASSERLGLWRRTAPLSHPRPWCLLDRGSVALDGADYVYAGFEYPDDNPDAAGASRTL